MAADVNSQPVHPFERHVQLMLPVAMLLFAYTIAIGILNGLDIVEFTHRQLLSHLHGGTLGWMTLAILGVTLWLFGAAQPAAGGQRSTGIVWALCGVACVAIAGYVLAFATTMGVARPLAGTLTLVALLGFTLWAYGRARFVTLTVPRLLVLLGLTTSLLGAVFGVINGFTLARGWEWTPSTFFEAHAATMEVGFIIPAAMGLAEWGLRRNAPEERATRAGLVQVGLMLVAFLWVLGFVLADVEAVAGLGIMFAIIAVIIFFVRIWPFARQTSVLARGPERHALVGALLVGVTIVYVFVAIQLAGGDFDEIPRGQLLSFIHLMAIGGTTNALLAFVISLTRRTAPASMADDVVFWGVNIGLLGFVVALTSDVGTLIHLFVPIMGVALLVALAVHFPVLVRSWAAGRLEAAGRADTTP